MNSEDLWMILAGIILPFVAIFLSGVSIKRHEKCISSFYWALREKFARSYLKQNKVIKFVRKRLGMDADESVHWIICFFHYLQIVMVISPILILILSLFVQLEKSIVICFIIGLGPYGFICITNEIFTVIQVQRCKKIKKINPKYSKSDFYDWRG